LTILRWEKGVNLFPRNFLVGNKVVGLLLVGWNLELYVVQRKEERKNKGWWNSGERERESMRGGLSSSKS
jgi:hypothetical protein